MAEAQVQQGSLLPLANNATVLAADIFTRSDGIAEGVVLAITTDGQYVTWSVWRQRGQVEWVASNGDYGWLDLKAAQAAYDKRRGANG